MTHLLMPLSLIVFLTGCAEHSRRAGEHQDAPDWFRNAAVGYPRPCAQDSQTGTAAPARSDAGVEQSSSR